jgi:ADP-ribosyl-[dinitrogen reductase] hydrolase
MMPSREQFVGSVLGVAVGDALGQPIEAYPPERLKQEFGEIRDFMDGDPRLPLPLKAGQWTDDTQMTLDILRSLLRCGRIDPADIAREFVADHEAAGIRFSGFTVKYSLIRLKRGMPWDKSGLTDDQTQGNGSAMRVAPVGLWNWNDRAQLGEDAHLSSVITHAHPEAIAGSKAVAFMVAQALQKPTDAQKFLAETIAFIGTCRVADNLAKAAQLLQNRTPIETALRQIGTTGWVVHTVAAAAYCFLFTPEDFERSVIHAVMGGDDADTTAAVTGAISGAYNGVAAIPDRWRDGVERGAEIRQMASDLYDLTMTEPRRENFVSQFSIS